MWHNTLLIVSADNGGAPCGGSNYPCIERSRSTFYEGGVQSIAFVNGGLLLTDRKGKATQGFIHIADWYTTFCRLAAWCCISMMTLKLGSFLLMVQMCGQL